MFAASFFPRSFFSDGFFSSGEILVPDIPIGPPAKKKPGGDGKRFAHRRSSLPAARDYLYLPHGGVMVMVQSVVAFHLDLRYQIERDDEDILPLILN
jgi:hypothetical protein